MQAWYDEIITKLMAGEDVDKADVIRCLRWLRDAYEAERDQNITRSARLGWVRHVIDCSARDLAGLNNAEGKRDEQEGRE